MHHANPRFLDLELFLFYFLCHLFVTELAFLLTELGFYTDQSVIIAFSKFLQLKPFQQNVSRSLEVFLSHWFVSKDQLQAKVILSTSEIQFEFHTDTYYLIVFICLDYK